MNSLGSQLSGKICLSIGHPEVIGFQRKILKAHSVPKKTKDPQKQSAEAIAQPEASKPKSAKRKSPVKTTRKTSAPRKRPSAKAQIRPEPSAEEIRHRAYFISERRAQLSLPADASADWLEARRQLFAEAGIAVS